MFTQIFRKMKLIVSIVALVIACNSCTKDDDPTKSYDTIDVEISKNELYVYDTQKSGDEDGGKIVEQAAHFNISEVFRDTTFKIVYRYKPVEDFVGEDKVKIELSSGSDGASPTTHIDYITINFKIK